MDAVGLLPLVHFLCTTESDAYARQHCLQTLPRTEEETAFLAHLSVKSNLLIILR